MRLPIRAMLRDPDYYMKLNLDQFISTYIFARADNEDRKTQIIIIKQVMRQPKFKERYTEILKKMEAIIPKEELNKLKHKHQIK